MKGTAIKELWESFDRNLNAGQTPKGRRAASNAFASKIMELRESKKIKDSDIDLKEMYVALVQEQDLEEDIDSSAFPNIAGQIISSVVIEAYQAFPKVGLSNVRVVPSKLKESRVVGWNAIGKIREVKEREDYKEVVPSDEKVVKIPNKKYGGLMTLTKEDIFFDQTGELLNRARGVGEEGARWQEELILKGFLDLSSNVYNKGALYSASAPTKNSDGSWTPGQNILSGATSALGTAGMEKMYMNLLAKTDEQAKPIWVMSDRLQVMIPANLWATAKKLQNNDYGPQGTANLDRNLFNNMFDFFVNPYYAAPTTAVDWYGGVFKRQFRWEEVWPLETYTRTGQDTEEGFKNDVIQQFKVSLYGGIGADDFRYIYKNAGV